MMEQINILGFIRFCLEMPLDAGPPPPVRTTVRLFSSTV